MWSEILILPPILLVSPVLKPPPGHPLTIMALPEVNFTKLFIDNKFVDSVSSSTYTTVNPATEEPICKVIDSMGVVDLTF